MRVRELLSAGLAVVAAIVAASCSPAPATDDATPPLAAPSAAPKSAARVRATPPDANSAVQSSPAVTGAVTGRVSRRDGGGPVAGVPVHLDVLSGDDWVRSADTLSDDDGSFRLDVVGPSEATVFAQGGGWCSVGLVDVGRDGPNPLYVAVPRSGDVAIDLVVEPSARAAVHVVDETGAGVSGVRVRGSPSKRPYGLLHCVSADAKSGTDGRVELADLVPGAEYWLHADVEGRGAATSPFFEVASGLCSEVQIRMPAVRFVDVAVVEEGTERPLAGAEVHLNVTDAAGVTYGAGEWTTGADGHARIGPLPDGARDVQALGSGLVPLPKPDAPDASRVVIRVKRRGTIAGRVVFPDGIAPRAVALELYGTEDVERRESSAADGAFRFSDIPACEFTVHARLVEGERTYAGHTNGETDTLDVLVALRDVTEEERKTQIRIRVVGPDGTAIPRAKAVLAEPPLQRGRARIRYGDVVDGRCAFEEQRPRRRRILVLGATDAAGARLPVGACVVDAPEPGSPDLLVRLAPERAIVGRVVDPAGRGVRGARVRVALSAKEFDDVELGDATTDVDGGFRVAQLGDDRCTVIVEPDGDHACSSPVEAEPGRDPLTIVVRSVPPVRVVVRDEDGAPVVGCDVFVKYQDPDPTGHSGVTDAQGGLTLRALDPAVERELHVNPPDGHTAYFPVVRPGWKPADVVIELERQRAVAGVVLDRRGKPVGGATVWREPRTEQMSGIGTGDDGRFVFDGLHRGDVFEVAATLPSNDHDEPKDPREWRKVVAGDENILLTVPTGPALTIACDDEADGWPTVAIFTSGQVVARRQAFPVSRGWKERFHRLDPAKRYDVLVTRPEGGDYALLRGVSPSDEMHRATFVGGGTLSGAVTLSTGAPAQMIAVLASRDGLVVETGTDETGAFELKAMPPGSWHVTAEAVSTDGSVWRGEGDVTAGTRLVVELRRAATAPSGK